MSSKCVVINLKQFINYCFFLLGVYKITINRPERRNAFRPQTIKELIWAFNDARDDSSIGVIILTGQVMLIAYIFTCCKPNLYLNYASGYLHLYSPTLCKAVK